MSGALIEPRSTRHHTGSVVDLCHERGWGVGTRLIGDEGYGPSVIEITAVGDNHLLAKCLGHSGGAVAPHEKNWVLWCRDWREATEDEIPVPFVAGTRVGSGKVVGTVVSGPDIAGCYVIDCDDGRRWIVKNPSRTAVAS